MHVDYMSLEEAAKRARLTPAELAALFRSGQVSGAAWTSAHEWVIAEGALTAWLETRPR